MSALFNRTSVIVFASAIAFGLFLFGASYPLDVRARGDAYGYLKIADSLSGVVSAFTYAGDRTSGLPFFEYAIHQALSIFFPTVYLQAWINTVGIAMLTIHIAASWSFSEWVRGVGLVKSNRGSYLLFFFLATCPPMVGHTTSPLSDTFSIDLILLGLVSLGYALRAQRIRMCLLFSAVAAAFLGFSILVRPASLIGLGVALVLCLGISFWGSRISRIAFGSISVGCLIVLIPGGLNCAQKYGSVCLQSPKTFNANLSMQEGLKGARLMWSQKNELPGTIPMVADEIMFNQYYRQCQIDSTIGFRDTSWSGCLLARPFTLPAFLAKKWIGLFDYFRFTPYLERLTPLWLSNLSRAYGALAWLGLSLCFATILKLRCDSMRSNLKPLLIENTGLVFLASYSMVMLAQHTALHTEERYGFPLIPLCVAVLFGYCERSLARYRAGERRSLLPSLLFCCLALTLYVAQVLAWDQASFVRN